MYNYTSISVLYKTVSLLLTDSSSDGTQLVPGVRTYNRYAELSHLPIILMRASGMPHAVRGCCSCPDSEAVSSVMACIHTSCRQCRSHRFDKPVPCKTSAVNEANKLARVDPLDTI